MNCWDCATYPDEAGFRARAARALAHRADAPWKPRSLSGEYFAPKEWDAQGRVTRYGGDPLKYDLPPVTAKLLRNPNDPVLREFLHIPGNLNQQYHFAAVGWCRLFGLLGDQLDLRKGLAAAVAEYRENRRPSDGEREHAQPLSVPHDLVGEPGDFVLGGNPRDGGTENHKTQWRTSGLLYARWFDRVSGHANPAARIQERLLDFLRRLAVTGNGEYDSTIYYVHTIIGYLNLYDFSPDPMDKLVAKLTLDYLIATYGLKFFNSVLVGPSKRGGVGKGETDAFMALWAGNENLDAYVQQATTTYRPNRVIMNILTKNVPLPFTAQMARPSYHMDRANVSQETFYCDRDFALGSIVLGEVDNPAQQTVWSAATQAGTLGGGMGHKPDEQVWQDGKSLTLRSPGETKIETRLPVTETAGRLDIGGVPVTPLAGKWTRVEGGVTMPGGFNIGDGAARVDRSRWADGGVYESPYVKVGGGRMSFFDGTEGYVVKCGETLEIEEMRL